MDHLPNCDPAHGNSGPGGPLPMPSPAAVVAVRLLEALQVSTLDEARSVLALWCKPSPRLAPADVRQILAQFNHHGGEVYERDEQETGAALPEGVEGRQVNPPYRRRLRRPPEG